ncbi:zinc finger protein, variant 1 [Loa loa]|uniref:Zinc finger protein, variant 1 n=1 Tax=Loa loa TaxID=7209 RepID=A0A1S0ULY4_LOALO|nr:zinc finger protein, variant 1 [Loa loa]EJD76595.1 zinc finger protein, variant 1 [Loa loa]
MAANNIANIKWNHFGVYRRFQLPVDVVGDLYRLLLVKINTVVPDFMGKLGWKDEDGDIIYFSTDEELRNALQIATNNQLRIQTIEDLSQREKEKSKDTKKENKKMKEIHPFVTCNRCDQPLYGIRYKCCVCDDFDLCEECEKEGTHPDHALIRYATPRTPKVENLRPRRTWRQNSHTFGHRDTFFQEGIFGRTAAAAAHASAAASAAAQHAARHAAAAATHFADNTKENTDGLPPQFRESVAQGMEYLKEVGSQIQQALANFGIEVDMDVQHGGVSEKIPKTQGSTTKNAAGNNTANDEKEDAQKTDEINVSKIGEPDSEDGKRKSDGPTAQNVEAIADELDVPLKKMHISEHEETEKLEQNSKEPMLDALASCDDISDEWTMMDISNPSSKCQSSAPLYPVIANGKCMAGTPFIVPQPGPHNPHCYFIYPGPVPSYFSNDG